MENEVETWRAVEGYENYEISSHGRVLSLKFSGGSDQRVLKGTPDKDGYLRVRLTDSRGSSRLFFIHWLVAHAFLGDCPDGHEINHKFGVKTDNRASHLEFCSRHENMQHAARTGLLKHAKLNFDDAQAIRDLSGTATQSEIARRFGVSQPQISNILAGKQWGHIAPSDN